MPDALFYDVFIFILLFLFAEIFRVEKFTNIGTLIVILVVKF